MLCKGKPLLGMGIKYLRKCIWKSPIFQDGGNNEKLLSTFIGVLKVLPILIRLKF